MAFPIPDRTVVISLPDSPRMASFRATWQEAGWTPALGEPVLIEGVAGEHGCWASHCGVLQAALMDGVHTLAVFEDDVVLAPDRLDYLKAVMVDLPDDADALWLDSTSPGPGTLMLPGSFGAARVTSIPGHSNGYVLRRAAISKLLLALKEIPGPVGQRFAGLDLRMAGLQVYATTPCLALEGGDVARGTTDATAEWSQLDGQRSNRSRWLSIDWSRLYEVR